MIERTKPKNKHPLNVIMEEYLYGINKSVAIQNARIHKINKFIKNFSK